MWNRIYIAMDKGQFRSSILCTAFVLCNTIALATGSVTSKSSPESLQICDELKEVLRLTNDIRASHGLMPFALNDKLTQAASWMALDMAKNNYCGHTDFLGRPADKRIEFYQYKYQVVAENVAAGQTSAKEVLDDWMKSPGHRRNILDPELKEIGLGFIYDPSQPYKYYWVQDFGAPRN